MLKDIPVVFQAGVVVLIAVSSICQGTYIPSAKHSLNVRTNISGIALDISLSTRLGMESWPEDFRSIEQSAASITSSTIDNNIIIIFYDYFRKKQTFFWGDFLLCSQGFFFETTNA